MTPPLPSSAGSPRSSPSDEALMQRLAAPQSTPEELERAAEMLVDRHARDVYRYFVRRGIQTQAAEDLVQEVFLSVVRERGRYDTARPFLPWLYTLAHNRMVSEARRRDAEQRALDGLEARQQAGAPRTEEATEHSEAWAQTQRALAALPDDDREVLCLARFEGLDYAQIGSLMGISAGTARVRAFRALQKLRQLLGVPSDA